MKRARQSELEVGGPDLLTQNQIAGLAFEAIGKKEKITHIPIWIKNLTLFFVRLFSSQKTYGPIEFFMTVMTRDMIAPVYGRRHLIDFFKRANISRFTCIKMLLGIENGEHIDLFKSPDDPNASVDDQVLCVTCTDYRLEPADPDDETFNDLDGEVIEKGVVQGHVLPGAMKIFCF